MKKLVKEHDKDTKQNVLDTINKFSYRRRKSEGTTSSEGTADPSETSKDTFELSQVLTEQSYDSHIVQKTDLDLSSLKGEFATMDIKDTPLGEDMFRGKKAMENYGTSRSEGDRSCDLQAKGSMGG